MGAIKYNTIATSEARPTHQIKSSESSHPCIIVGLKKHQQQTGPPTGHGATGALTVNIRVDQVGRQRGHPSHVGCQGAVTLSSHTASHTIKGGKNPEARPTHQIKSSES